MKHLLNQNSSDYPNLQEMIWKLVNNIVCVYVKSKKRSRDGKHIMLRIQGNGKKMRKIPDYVQ